MITFVMSNVVLSTRRGAFQRNSGWGGVIMTALDRLVYIDGAAEITR